jgi:hypothetical protein
MNQDGFCEQHGPYDARLGDCPFCARQAYGRPQPPPLLDQEEPTDPWGGRSHRSRYNYEDDLEETDPKAGRDAMADDDLDVTDLPQKYKRNAWDPGFDDATEVDRPAKTGLLGWLIVKEGSLRGRTYEIKDGAVIGRDDQATLVIRDPKISRMHARINIEDNHFVVWDFGSENGTHVNGERIRSATPVQENDTIKIGNTLFVLKTLE